MDGRESNGVVEVEEDREGVDEEADDTDAEEGVLCGGGGGVGDGAVGIG